MNHEILCLRLTLHCVLTSWNLNNRLEKKKYKEKRKTKQRLAVMPSVDVLSPPATTLFPPAGVRAALPLYVLAIPFPDDEW